MFLISWLQSPSAVILEPPKIKSVTVSTVSPSIYRGIRWTLNPVNGVFIKGAYETQMRTPTDGNISYEGRYTEGRLLYDNREEIAVRLLQTKKTKDFWQTPKARRERMALPTP